MSVSTRRISIWPMQILTQQLILKIAMQNSTTLRVLLTSLRPRRLLVRQSLIKNGKPILSTKPSSSSNTRYSTAAPSSRPCSTLD